MPTRAGDIQGFVDSFREGFRAGGVLVRGRIWRGRFPEEVNVEALVESSGCREPLFHVKVFSGRPPYYRPWLEVHTVYSRACGVSFDGVIEDAVLDLAGLYAGPGVRVFVEYEWDRETLRELEAGVPPALSRLGYKLLVRGFTWFKDWYYPEGFMEGGRKLQAEKPVTRRQAEGHLRELAEQARALLEGGPAPGAEGAAARAHGILRLLGLHYRL
ncbi:DUF1122 family protein [Stetteria hydrogenophila]